MILSTQEYPSSSTRYRQLAAAHWFGRVLIYIFLRSKTQERESVQISLPVPVQQCCNYSPVHLTVGILNRLRIATCWKLMLGCRPVGKSKIKRVVIRDTTSYILQQRFLMAHLVSFFPAQTMLLYVENPPESHIFSICQSHVLVRNFFDFFG